VQECEADLADEKMPNQVLKHCNQGLAKNEVSIAEIKDLDEFRIVSNKEGKHENI